MKNSISLIVPIYDAPEKLERFLKSLLNIERGSLFQLIVIDDHSPICLNSIFEHYRDQLDMMTTKFIRHEVNLGRAAARNTGLKFATGNFVYFVDVDNLPQPKAFVNIINCFSDDVACVRGNVRCDQHSVSRSAYVKFFDSRYLGNRHSENVQLDFNYFATDAVCIRKSVLDQVGSFDEAFTKYGCEDEELGCRIKQLGLRFLFCSTSKFIDTAEPSLKKESSRMIEYAEFSVPYLLSKHPSYAKTSLFSSLEFTPTIFSRLKKSIYLLLLRRYIASFLMRILVRLDTKLSVVPKYLYFYVLATHYKIGFENRQGTKR